MAQLFFNPFPAFFDSTGAPFSGGTLQFYENGTVTPLDTYPTEADEQADTNANDNPITLNSSGWSANQIFLKNQAYTVVLKDSTGDTIFTANNVRGTDLGTVVETKVGDGAPTGSVAGTASSAGVLPTFYWDFTNAVLYVCTTTGNAASAVWTALNASAATPSVPEPQGYLTLDSGNPVITSDQADKTVVYYTPFKGNLVPLYNGTGFTPTEFSELTLTLVASHASATIYDVFVWSESGVLTIGTGPAWNNSTAGSGARGTGASTTQLTRVNGLLVNAVEMATRNSSNTFTVGANLATYVGSILIDSTAGQVTCHRSFGQSRVWGVWNAYNRMPIILKAGDSTATWTYTLATFRAANADSDNSLTVLCGLAEEVVSVSSRATFSPSSGIVHVDCGVGWNSTSAFSGLLGSANSGSDRISLAGPAEYIPDPFIGINVATALESSEASGTTTWRGGEDDMLLLARYMG